MKKEAIALLSALFADGFISAMVADRGSFRNQRKEVLPSFVQIRRSRNSPSKTLAQDLKKRIYALLIPTLQLESLPALLLILEGLKLSRESVGEKVRRFRPGQSLLVSRFAFPFWSKSTIYKLSPGPESGFNDAFQFSELAVSG